MEKTADTSTTSWVSTAVWVLLGAAILFIWMPMVSFVCIVLGLVGAHVGVPKTNPRRRVLILAGWLLLAVLAVVITIGAIVWNSFELV